MRDFLYVKERILYVLIHAIYVLSHDGQENGRTSEDYVYESYLTEGKGRGA